MIHLPIERVSPRKGMIVTVTYCSDRGFWEVVYVVNSKLVYVCACPNGAVNYRTRWVREAFSLGDATVTVAMPLCPKEAL